MSLRTFMYIRGFQRLPPARGGTAQKKIIHLANWSQLIHPGPASSLTKIFLLSSKSCVNADSLLIRAAATSTSGTLNDLTTDLIMANNNNMYIRVNKDYYYVVTLSIVVANIKCPPLLLGVMQSFYISYFEIELQNTLNETIAIFI